MNLRPYQQDAVVAIERGWEEYRSQLLVLPTGCGKTIAFAALAKKWSDEGMGVLIIAHREELLEQAQDKIKKATGLDTALEKANSTGYDSFFNVCVASVQTLHSARLKKWDQGRIQRIIIDEAHHALADSYARPLEYFKDAKVLGVTATPDRGDKKTLGERFENIAYEYSLRQAIKDGYLSPIVAQMSPLDIDLSGVKIVAGDYDADGLDSAITPYLMSAAQTIKQNATDRKTLVFLPLVRTSQAFVEACRSIGLTACHIDGQSEDRKEILQRYATGEFQVLSNASLLTEGYDCPDISCVVCLRPTKSRPLYSQIIGRGTRLAPGKENLLVLDFLWHTAKHELCVPASLFAKTADEAKQVMESIRVGGGSRDLIKAEEDVQRQREEKLREQLRMNARRNKKTVNPIEFALGINAEDLYDYEPTMQWEMAKASEKQIQLLARFGIDASAINSKGQASKIIDRLMQRRQAGLCTVKQANILMANGINPAGISFQRATALIDEIMKSWKKTA